MFVTKKTLELEMARLYRELDNIYRSYENMQVEHHELSESYYSLLSYLDLREIYYPDRIELVGKKGKTND